MLKKILFLSVIVFLVTVLNAGQTIDSLAGILPKSTGINRVNILCDLCWEYRFVSGDSALIYGSQALELAEAIDYNKGVAQAYNDMGIIHVDRGSYAIALDFFNHSMEIRKKLNDSLGMASLYNKMGIVYQKQGKLKEALENAIQALNMYEALGQELWIGYSLNNIAIINYNMGDLSTSIDYHQRALVFRKKLHDRYGEAGSYGNIANVFLEMGDTTLAIANYQKALQITREIKNDESTAAMLANLGTVYLYLGEHNKALNFLNESLQIRERLKDQKAIASSLLKLGTVNMNLKHIQLAGDLLYRGLRIARSIGVIEEEMQAYKEIARWHAQQRNMDSAFIYMDYYSNTRDSVYEQRLSQQIIDTQAKYETEKKEQALELLQHENQLVEISLRQRKTEILLLIFIIISLVGAGIFLFYRRQHKQKLALDLAIIRHNEQRIQAVLDGQEEERRRIARELHDGVGQSLSGVKLKWESISGTIKSDTLRENLQSLSDLIDGAATEVRTISHQMLPKELEQFGLVTALESILHIIKGSGGMACTFNYHNMNERLSQVIELGLFRIAQELINNINKHAEATEVNVQLLKRSKHLVFIVEDNGKGFDYELNKSTGIGLMNIESRVQGLKGILHYESKPRSGTLVTIRIPL